MGRARLTSLPRQLGRRNPRAISSPSAPEGVREVPARGASAGLGCRSRAPRPGEVHASAAAAPAGPVLSDPRPAGDVDRRAESPRARAAGPARLLLSGFTSS